MLKRIAKVFISLLIALPLITIVVMNFRLYHFSAISHEKLMELRGLKNSLDENADRDMQNLYPEGYIFFNALYGLTWCSYVERLDRSSSLFREGHLEIQRAFNNVNSATGRAPFDEDLSLSYGAFYNGWCTYLLGKKLSIENPENRNANEVVYFTQHCDKIADVLRNKPFPVSYPAMAWPADAVVCVAALSLHDKIFSPAYSLIIENWLDDVRNRLDKNGLIPHRVNPSTGKTIQQARGSSQSLILIFLREINEEFSREQFQLYKRSFSDSKIGLSGIREYAPDEYGLGDIDSGPVFLQIGAAATIVGSRTMIDYGEMKLGVAIRKEIEAFGFPLKRNNEKKYLMGMLPMADAFIAWTHVDSNGPESEKPRFHVFHLYSFLFCLVSCVLLWLIWRSKKTRNTLYIHW